MFKNWLKEFQEFAMRGSVVDLAVGIIIGAAFSSIVNSLVNDIVMPPIGYILGGVDFSNLFIDLTRGGYESLAAAQEAGAATINYGVFLNNLINFLIIALVVFILVKQFNNLQKRFAHEEEKPPAEPTTKDCPYCYTEIPIQATRCPHCTSELEKS